jgi:hypothetical protein
MARSLYQLSLVSHARTRARDGACTPASEGGSSATGALRTHLADRHPRGLPYSICTAVQPGVRTRTPPITLYASAPARTAMAGEPVRAPMTGEPVRAPISDARARARACEPPARARLMDGRTLYADSFRARREAGKRARRDYPGRPNWRGREQARTQSRSRVSPESKWSAQDRVLGKFTRPATKRVIRSSCHGFGEAGAGLRAVGMGAPGIEPGTSRV